MVHILILHSSLKRKKSTINPKHGDDKCFQYAVTGALNYGKIKSHLETVSNIKPFINKYNWKGINYPAKMDDWKSLKKIIQQLLLIFCILKKRKCTLLIFQNITQPVRKELFS